jgi:hypothetical protein
MPKFNIEDLDKNYKDMDWSKFGENSEYMKKMKEQMEEMSKNFKK